MTTTRRTAIATALFAGAALLAVPAAATPRVGSPAPAFSAVDSTGKTVNLADMKGKTVVLEWTNDECPFVKKHYSSAAMQGLQKKWTEKGIVWLSVISSIPGEQGYADAAKANKLTADRGASPTAVLLDPKGDVGRSYGAQVTPHMYIISGDGTLAYMGGIDDKPSTKVEDLKTARNHVDAALSEITTGKAVSVSTSRPYGCTVKYSS